MKTKTLLKTKQCRHCPWRKDSDLSKIPNYSRAQHEDLENTIADDGNLTGLGKSLNVMACHNKQISGEDLTCIGWLVNQVGVGNNIPARIQLLSYDNGNEIETFGEQFETFEETLRQKNC